MIKKKKNICILQKVIVKTMLDQHCIDINVG